ncbi:MAG: FkbM family methyltransferase [Putridiphycobacter sp.]
MKALRKLLVKVFGIKTYLSWVSNIYINLIKMGFSRDKYAELYFIQKIIKKGDTVLDIGANLGYYSFFMDRQVGTSGKLLAVEPIPIFADIWKKNLKASKKPHIKLFNCALGSEEQEKVKMSIPIVNGVVRHGLTNVEGQGESHWESLLDFEVPMFIGDTLLEKEALAKLNYIKCDVEGYEQYVMPSLKATIEKFKPVIQIELNGKENRQNVVDFLVSFKYDVYILNQDKLQLIENNAVHDFNQDFYFINRSKVSNYAGFIEN